MAEDRLKQQRYWHALPEGWPELDYETFLTERRRLMSDVVRDAYTRLAEQAYAPVYPQPGTTATTTAAVASARRTPASYGVRLAHLIEADLLAPGTVLRPAQGGYDAEAIVLPDGKIAYEGEVFNSPSAVSDFVTGGHTNGWIFWVADTSDGSFTLAALRERYLADRQ
jgi:hypothetical protein